MYFQYAGLSVLEGTCCGRFCKKYLEKDSPFLNKLLNNPSRAGRERKCSYLSFTDQDLNDFSDKLKVTRAASEKARTYRASSSIPG